MDSFEAFWNSELLKFRIKERGTRLSSWYWTEIVAETRVDGSEEWIGGTIFYACSLLRMFYHNQDVAYVIFSHDFCSNRCLYICFWWAVFLIRGKSVKTVIVTVIVWAGVRDNPFMCWPMDLDPLLYFFCSTLFSHDQGEPRCCLCLLIWNLCSLKQSSCTWLMSYLNLELSHTCREKNMCWIQ